MLSRYNPNSNQGAGCQIRPTVQINSDLATVVMRSENVAPGHCYTIGDMGHRQVDYQSQWLLKRCQPGGPFRPGRARRRPGWLSSSQASSVAETTGRRTAGRCARGSLVPPRPGPRAIRRSARTAHAGHHQTMAGATQPHRCGDPRAGSFRAGWRCRWRQMSTRPQSVLPFVAWQWPPRPAVIGRRSAGSSELASSRLAEVLRKIPRAGRDGNRLVRRHPANDGAGTGRAPVEGENSRSHVAHPETGYAVKPIAAMDSHAGQRSREAENYGDPGDIIAPKNFFDLIDEDRQKVMGRRRQLSLLPELRRRYRHAVHESESNNHRPIASPSARPRVKGVS